MIGSIYGEGIYSADLYSWEVAWGHEVCDETEALVRREKYRPPPIAVWPGQSCFPLTVRETYRPPPSASWSVSACDPLTVRRTISSPPQGPEYSVVGFRFSNFRYGNYDYSHAEVRIPWPSSTARRATATIGTRGLPSGHEKSVTAQQQL